MPSRTPTTVLAMLLLLASAASAEEEAYSVALDLDRAGFKSWFETHKTTSRTVMIDAWSVGGEAKFAVVFRPKDTQDWQTHLEITGEELREKLRTLEPEHYHPATLAGYLDSGVLKYAASWIRDGTASNRVARLDLSSKELQDALRQARGKSQRPYYIRGYQAAKGVRYSLLLDTDDGSPWKCEYNLTSAEYQKTCDKWSGQEYRPLSVCGYWAGTSVRHAAVFVKDRGVEWAAKHDLDSSDFAAENAKHRADGFMLTSLSGYSLRKASAFSAVWSKGTPERRHPLPASGTPVPELKAFDDAMIHFMRERNIPCGTLAVGRNGKLLYARGFGYRDRKHQHPVLPSTLFRLASVSKPITAAAVRQLIDAGKLESSAKVFDVLELLPADPKKLDPRWRNITIHDLLHHRGGWDREKTFDPMFRSAEIMKDLGRTGPAAPRDVIDYMLARPLQFTPGSKYSYSNFGYCLLGRVIEKLSGRSYMEYIEANIAKPLGMRSLALGRSLPEHRNPAEPWYSSQEIGRNVFRDELEAVPAPDGGFHLEAMDSHGGLVCSAPDLVKFLEAYWIDGLKRSSPFGPSQRQFGSLTGTWTLARQRGDGVVIAALFNQRTERRQLYDEKVFEELDAAVDSIESWPEKEVGAK